MAAIPGQLLSKLKDYMIFRNVAFQKNYENTLQKWKNKNLNVLKQAKTQWKLIIYINKIKLL